MRLELVLGVVEVVEVDGLLLLLFLLVVVVVVVVNFSGDDGNCPGPSPSSRFAFF